MTNYAKSIRWLLISLALHGLALAAFQWLPDPEPARIALSPGQSAPVIALQSGFVTAPTVVPPPPEPEVEASPKPEVEASPALIEGQARAPLARVDEPAADPVETRSPSPEPKQAPPPESAAPPMPENTPRSTPATPPILQPKTEGEQSLTAAKVRRAPLPPYPNAALRAGLSDVVTLLEVDIDARGRVSDARILQSCGRSDMDRSALNTVRRVWRFQPAKQFGKAVPSRETIEIFWQIR